MKSEEADRKKSKKKKFFGIKSISKNGIRYGRNSEFGPFNNLPKAAVLKPIFE
jgi:hypothetical protein